MQNIVKTLMSGFKALVNKKIRGSVADWAQNDAEADNYVKNRTHWEEDSSADVEVIPEMTVNIIDDDGCYATLSESCPVLTVGKTYTVVFNGVEYQCVAREYGDNDTLIGNGTIYGDDNEGNGEPFSIDSYDDGLIYLNTETAGEYTIRIFYHEDKVVVHKLDDKYLPDSVANASDLAELQSVVENDIATLRTVHESDIGSIQTDINTVNTTVGTKVSYTETQTLTNSQKMKARTNIGAGEPQVHSDWGQNDANNVSYIYGRTHYDWVETLEMGLVNPASYWWQNAPKVSINNTDFYYFNMGTQIVPTLEQILGQQFTVQFMYQTSTSTSSSTTHTRTITEDNVDDHGTFYYVQLERTTNGSPYLISVLFVTEDTVIDGVEIARDIYFTTNKPTNFVSIIRYGENRVVELDEKYIPDSIARINFVENYAYEPKTHMYLSDTENNFDIYKLEIKNGVLTSSLCIDLILRDFTYTVSDDGIYTITGWNETLGGETSTELVIPETTAIDIEI